MEHENEKLRFEFDDPEAIAGIVQKIAKVSTLEVTDADLKKINKYTLEPVTADEVFVFKATMADNEQDDRNFMPFNLKALQDLKELYVGKTMLKDHSRMADNQIARVYDTELVQNPNKTTELGELHTELIGKIYMIKTESNKDLIAEIKGGIKREVSTSTVPKKMICSICGTDNMKDYCRHYPSQSYDVADATGKMTKKTCRMLLHGAKEAYELSFVAVPAQPRASTHKSVGFAKPIKEKITETDAPQKDVETKDSETLERLAEARLKRVESFFNSKEEI